MNQTHYVDKGSIEDRLAIRELIETFAVGVTTIDSTLWGDTWSDTGVWKTPSMPEAVVGKTNIIAKFEEMLAYVKFMSMSAVPSGLVFHGDEATGKSFCRELIFPKNSAPKIVIGYFEDVFAKVEGRWLFQSRMYHVIGAESVVAAE